MTLPFRSFSLGRSPRLRGRFGFPLPSDVGDLRYPSPSGIIPVHPKPSQIGVHFSHHISIGTELRPVFRLTRCPDHLTSTPSFLPGYPTPSQVIPDWRRFEGYHPK